MHRFRADERLTTTDCNALGAPPKQSHKLRTATLFACAVSALISLSLSAKATEIPSAVAANDRSVVETVHATGVQIYECKMGTDAKLTWQFREPLATLIAEGKTVGRHFAGPGWEFEDGSRIKGKMAAQAPGATKNDIPVLRLEVVEHAGVGKLSEVSTVQRVETSGGVFGGNCEEVGSMHPEPYSADYIFLK